MNFKLIFKHSNYLTTRITILCTLLLNSCATTFTGPRSHLDLMGGFKETKNVVDTEVAKKGTFYGLRYYIGYQTMYLGRFGWAFGFQETNIEGKNSMRHQQLINRSGFIDLSYFLPSGDDSYLLGVLHRTFMGPGVEYGMNEKHTWQTVSHIGPQIQKFIGERTVIGAALLRSYGFEKRTIVQIPIYIGWKF